MPNWCSGSLKLRGQYENQVKFLTEGLNEYSYNWDDEKQQSVEIVIPKDRWIRRIEEYGEVGARGFDMEIEPGEWVYVEGTKRAFITSDYIEFTEENEIIITIEINQAWDFRVDDWINISKKYGLDIKLWGVDRGWGFMHEIEIVKGEVASDISKNWDNYNDFLWECPLPWLGG